MHSHHIELNGRSFHYLEWGHAGRPVLLFLHGFPEYAGAWAELAGRLAPQFHCIAPDQRGYGQSWAPPQVSAYRSSELVGDMTALIAHLGGGPVTVIGHDWGSAVAYGLAMFQPHLVDRLIVMNGVHPGPFQRAMAAGGAQTLASQYMHTLKRDGAEDRLSAQDYGHLLSVFSAKMDMSWLTGDKLAAYKTEWARPGRLRGMLNWYRASPLKLGAPGQPIKAPAYPTDKFQVPMPHLLIWGMQDTALLPEATQGLESWCPDLTRVQVPDADHWLAHQQPGTVAEIIRTWLDTRT
ncbi:alpha/beta fold hydrolase [Thalassobius sp. S69A]|uniref:alpha/beta fold hydrolase n=1 Tax=unclassified Thalassovita TaxID=2619711 RepID=UPI000C105B3E|nr:alpha/beta hydrolase [Paracoccaceae bacterium]MBT25718.1 alpha/beta hydrolase [Paracoccaceae bacterium]